MREPRACRHRPQAGESWSRASTVTRGCGSPALPYHPVQRHRPSGLGILKFGIEHYRQRKPHCSGTLIWQLNDCWPVLSWSILDYYGFGKAGYFYTRRAYAPVLASFKARAGGGIELWITNDTLNEITDTLTIRFGTFVDGTAWEESSQIRVGANGNQVVWQGEADKIIGGPDNYMSVHSTTSLFPANRHFFSPIKELPLTPTQPEITITSHGEHELQVHFQAVTYTYFLHLQVPDERTHFTDNYFDLEAGERRDHHHHKCIYNAHS